MSVSNLTSLLKQADIEDHEGILKAAESALRQSKGDIKIQHVKAVALLKLDRYEDSVKAFEAGGKGLKDRAGLEYAYALYKSGRPAEAAKAIEHNASRGAKHIEAQASYRTENFERAAELYKELATNLESDVKADLAINTGAVDAQLEWAGQGELVQKKRPAREELEAFETAYNAACGSIARGELGQAEVLLKRTRDLCNALEDLSEMEKQAEMLPITVQQVYVLTRQGRTEEAEKLAQSIEAHRIPDLSTRYLAQVNGAAAVSTHSNSFLVQRLVATDIDSLNPDSPFRFQSAILEQNSHAIGLQSLKFKGAAKSTETTISDQSAPNLDGHCNSLSVVNAAAHAKNQSGKEALKHILPLLEKRPSDVGLVLTIAQIYVLTGNLFSALTLLTDFLTRLEQSNSSVQLNVRFAPGLVGTLVSLYHGLGQKGRAQAELSKAATHWRRKPKERPTGVIHLLKAAGSVLLESQENEHRRLATDIFSELHERDGSDRYAAAGLLAATPQSTSSPQTSTLQPLDRLIAGIDADALENAGVAHPPSSNSTAAATTTRKRQADDAKPKKPAKIRKSRIPKGYDPSKKPDPERWLPLRDRSTYRPKGKKSKARQALLSQGATAAGESDSSRPATPGNEVLKPKQVSGGGAGGGKKKKGKGGKW